MTAMNVGGLSYTWSDETAVTPIDSSSAGPWVHHGLAVLAGGRLVGFQSGTDRVWLLDRETGDFETWATGLGEGHGITVARQDDVEILWLADCDVRAVRDGSGGFRLDRGGRGRVVAFDIEGNRITELPRPDLDVYATGGYAPTSVAVDDGPEGDGGIWVADGYGQSLVHRFSRDGELELTLTGDEGAGRFDCPHGLLIDRRSTRPRLYVTDRRNARLQIFSLEGTFLGVADEGLRSPSALVAVGDRLIVGELHARLTVLDAEDRLIGYLGRDDDAPERDGWPNAIVDGETVRPENLAAGRFNSPHGLAADADGTLYVAEWLIGGRLIRLTPLPAR